MTTTTKNLLLFALVTALAGGCGTDLMGRGGASPLGGLDDGRAPRVEGTFSPEEATGGEENTFHHPESIDGAAAIDAREVLTRMAEQGPPGYRARVHGCRKMRYGTVGRMLDGLGVDLQATGEWTAGRMWREADQALGAPNYAARIAETTELTTASASRLFDILVQAAPEIMANMPAEERCTIDGVGAQVFDPVTGSCTLDGLSCLLGEPATADHVALCNAYASRATTPEKGRVLAVAAILAAAATCE